MRFPIEMLIVVLALVPAHAKELYPGQFADVPAAVGEWFKSQAIPGTHSACCDSANGTMADEDFRGNKRWTKFTYVHFVNGAWVEAASDWMEVPNATIIRDGKPNPTGGAVVWYTIYTERQGEVLKIRCYKPANEY